LIEAGESLATGVFSDLAGLGAGGLPVGNGLVSAGLLGSGSLAGGDAAGRFTEAQVQAQAARLPWMYRVGKVMITGRIGGVCFAPDAPHLAVGTAAARVGLWDLAAGRML